MPFFKPYTYVDGTVITSDNQNANDVDAKRYINQDIVQSDYDDGVFDTSDIQRGELDPVTNHHQFTTGEVWGRFNDSVARDRSYWTAHTKTNDATQISDTSKQYQAVYECGDTIVMENDGTVFFTFGATFISTSNDVNTKGKWDSKVYLMFATEAQPQPQIIQGTRCYSYEETSAVASAGATDPGSVNYIIGSPPSKNDYNQNRRWIQFQWMVQNLAAGTYKFFVAVNPKVEIGFSSARQFTAEIFYDERFQVG
tara:strand:- start:2601 stop:3362 length:762 start_codon:yes stop_codon:yes gene_type:complete